MENFFKKNRAFFDYLEPSDRIWSGIEAAVLKKDYRLLIWKSVAAIFILITCLLLFQRGIGYKKDNLAQHEFEDTERFYFSQIKEKVLMIKSFDPFYHEDQINQELTKLLAMYEVLKVQMEEKPSSEVRDAMILNLLVRLDLLNMELERLSGRDRKGKITG